MVEEQNRITPEILQKCVAKEFSADEKDVEITDLDVSPGAAYGDNFATVVKLAKFKYKLNGKENLHSYIYKEVPHNEFREKFIREVRKRNINVPEVFYLMPDNKKYIKIVIKYISESYMEKRSSLL